ncbi:MAG: 16S rRNA (guanine(527)-N(7))-methyltransferase RsmG [Bacilli bacterium]|nr:16S rRNA (guanine(527)-N(7))-methyltransferase RsmG [Bacilli bacterium]
MNKDEFLEELKKINIELTKIQLEQLDKYYNLLLEWNSKINLTRIIEEKEVYLKHFYDSITLIKAIDLNNSLTICDVGTGAGFPGIVLKIVFPNLNITLVDALNKRIEFLKLVINELKLKNIEAIHDRAENFIRNNRNKYDLITCRAVSKLNIISELCIPGVKVNGYFIPMKANIDEEIQNLEFLNKLDSKLEKIVSFNLPVENSIRNLLVIKKIKDTNSIYPRNYDKIIKRPL